MLNEQSRPQALWRTIPDSVQREVVQTLIAMVSSSLLPNDKKQDDL
jgi:hypothetical protein